MTNNIQPYLDRFDKLADDFNSGMSLGKYEKLRWRKFLKESLESVYVQGAMDVIEEIPLGTPGKNGIGSLIQQLKAKLTKTNH